MKDTDLELLELAAKVAGIEVRRGEGWQSDMLFRRVRKPSSPLVAGVHWNPLDDDGDALRLAVALCMHLSIGDGGTVSACFDDDDRDASIKAVETYMPDPLSATRRAIVRAAAEIGREMA